MTLAVLGGSPAAIAAQQLLRHKTRKQPFRTLLWLIAGAQAVALLAALLIQGLGQASGNEPLGRLSFLTTHALRPSFT